MIDGHIITAPDRTKGFDTNVPLDKRMAKAFFDNGYRFCVRYVARVTPHTNDLSAGEAQLLLDAGLGIMVVQHVESEDGWTPAPGKGASYGETAARITTGIGVPAGAMIWLDLEGVAGGVSAGDVIGYCNSWHAEVAGAGFLPGLYVGWHARLTPDQLYRELRFTHYWGAYNLNADEAPAKRGLQMKQAVAGKTDKVPGVTFLFQKDTVRTDALGGRPVVFAPESWLE